MSMCLLSMLYDTVNNMTLEVQTGTIDGSKLELLLKHLSKVQKGDILLLDRGYPARYLFSALPFYEKEDKMQDGLFYFFIDSTVVFYHTAIIIKHFFTCKLR